jgi:hypothetical protein
VFQSYRRINKRERERSGDNQSEFLYSANSTEGREQSRERQWSLACDLN